uniref:13E12 repeat family protein n=1 Tax=Frankia tisae TaxID=2950104 RepID=UPI0021BF2FA6
MVYGENSGDDPDPPARLAVIVEQVDGLLAADMWQLSDGELDGLIEGICRLTGRVAAVRGQLFVEAQDRGFAVHQGATDLAAWLRERLRLTTREARRHVTLARDTTVCTATGAALASGEITAEQLTVRLRHHRSIMTPTGVEDPAAAGDLLSAGRSAAGPARGAAPHDPQR